MQYIVCLLIRHRLAIVDNGPSEPSGLDLIKVGGHRPDDTYSQSIHVSMQGTQIVALV